MEDSVFPSFLIAGVSDLLDLLDPVLKRSITTIERAFVGGSTNLLHFIQCTHTRHHPSGNC